MSMIKRFLEDYCEAVHPDDFDAQDALFESICEGRVTVPLEEMQRKIEEYRGSHPDRVQTPAPPG